MIVAGNPIYVTTVRPKCAFLPGNLECLHHVKRLMNTNSSQPSGYVASTMDTGLLRQKNNPLHALLSVCDVV